MNNVILIYITCKNVSEAKRIGKILLEKRLCGCINILPKIHSLYFWPPKSGTIEEANEAILLAKTISSKYQKLETLIHQIHSYDTPDVMAIPLSHMDKKYEDWLMGEINK